MMHPLVRGTQDNQFPVLLADGIRGSEAVVPFAWVRFITGYFDVCHVHWPEALLRHRWRSMAFAKTVAFALGIFVAVARRRVLALTVHNTSPHETLNPFAKRIWRLYARRASVRVYMTKHLQTSAPLGEGIYLPHGTYHDELHANGIECIVEMPEVAGGIRVGCVGQVRRYKQFETVLGLVEEVPETLSVLLAGAPTDEAYVDELLTRYEPVPNVNLIFKSMHMSELAAAIHACHVICLPYGETGNSGIALLALTLGRPVISRDSATMRELQDEVGSSWVEVLPAEWTVENFLEAAQRLVLPLDRPAIPPMPTRRWECIGSAHVRAYREALARR